jgi:hypothetical protein
MAGFEVCNEATQNFSEVHVGKCVGKDHCIRALDLLTELGIYFQKCAHSGEGFIWLRTSSGIAAEMRPVHVLEKLAQRAVDYAPQFAFGR